MNEAIVFNNTINDLIWGSISVAVLAYFKDTLLSVVNFLLKSLIASRSIDRDLSEYLSFYLIDHEDEWKVVVDNYNNLSRENIYDFEKKHRVAVLIGNFGESTGITFKVYRKGWRFIVVTVGDCNRRSSYIYTLRGLIDLDGLLKEVVDSITQVFREKEKVNKYYRFDIIRLFGRSRNFNISIKSKDDEGEVLEKECRGYDSMKDVVEEHPFSSFIVDDIDYLLDATEVPEQDIDYMKDFYINPSLQAGIKEFEFWLSKEDWFLRRNLPWKLSWCLYGDPGTGKSSMVKNIARKYNMPIFVMELGTFDDLEFLDVWDKRINKAYRETDGPFILVIEDIDSVFDGRESKVEGLTFSTVINAIQGVSDCEGMFLIITTNNINKLDQALGGPNVNGVVEELDTSAISRRPGRINKLIEMTNPDEEGRRIIAEGILDEFPEEIPKVVKEGSEDTGAQFKYRCQLRAVDLVFKEN